MRDILLLAFKNRWPAICRPSDLYLLSFESVCIKYSASQTVDKSNRYDDTNPLFALPFLAILESLDQTRRDSELANHSVANISFA